MRRRKQPVVRLSPPDAFVTALTDVYRGSHCITRGSRVHRDHEFVNALPEAFEVRYRLDQERSEDVSDCRSRVTIPTRCLTVSSIQ
jgi:hypothetical protein